MKQMRLLRMRAAIILPAQAEQRRSFWWGNDSVGNKPLNYIESIMKQMGPYAHARSHKPPYTDIRETLFWWGHDTVGNKPFNYIVIIMKQMGLLRMRAVISLPTQTEQRRSFWWDTTP
jgi:hypothetical protein